MEGRAWPDGVQRVVGFLKETGAEARVEQFLEGTPSADDAARAVGCELAQIVKSLVFDCDGEPALVLAPGDRRVDRRKVAAAAGCSRAQIVGAADVERLTGFAPGAVAPFPQPRIARVYIDRTLLTHSTVWIGAGSEHHLAALAPAELVRLSRARPVDVSDDSS